MKEGEKKSLGKKINVEKSSGSNDLPLISLTHLTFFDPITRFKKRDSTIHYRPLEQQLLKVIGVLEANKLCDQCLGYLGPPPYDPLSSKNIIALKDYLLI